jgi:hypothetical protein
VTSSSNPLARRLAVALVVCALALGAAACGDDDGGGGGSAIGEATGGDTDSGDGSDGSSDGGDAGGSTGTPQDADLDVQARSSEGATLTVSSIAFEGDNILVDLEVLNGSPEEISIHDTTWTETQLRLVDDEGNAYNFLQPDDAEDISLDAVAQGESISGTLEFMGPLVGETQELRLVTNMDADLEAINDWQPGDTCSNACGGKWPGLVAMIPLEWS